MRKFMKITNIKQFKPNREFKREDLHTLGEFLVGAHFDEEEVLDGQGLYVIPGLVDIHLHAAYGADFMDGDEKSWHKIARFEAEHGITSLCPTTMTMTEDEILKACSIMNSYKPSDNEAFLHGLYLEGPFISPNKTGAQNSEFIKKPNLEFVNKAIEASNNQVKFLGIAPELDGAIELISALRNKVICSIAHTACSYETAMKAIAAGVNHLTHLFNAMPPFLHRAPGPIGAAVETESCFCELISDGVHVHPSAVKAAFKLFGKDKIVLISDSMMATGLDTDKSYTLGGQEVFVSGKKATLKDGTIAGSVSTLFDCLKTAITQIGIPIEEAVACATYTPALCAGISDKVGSLNSGCYANLLFIDKNLELQGVMLRGKMLWQNF